MASLRTRGISQFKSTLVGGGARPNLFEVSITFPAGLRDNLQGDNRTSNAEIDTKFRFLCKAAALPASNIAPIDVPFRGRILKVAGDRTFDPWTVTIINDQDFSIRRRFENWMHNIGQYSDHSGLTEPASYMGTGIVDHLGRARSSRQPNSGADASSNAPIIAKYRFQDIFPTSISEIDLSYDNSDTIEEFTVEFQVQHFTPLPAGTPI